MSDINKQARDKLKSAAAKAADNFDPNMFVETRDVLGLLDELEAAEKRIAELEELEVNFSLPAELTVEDCDVLARTIEYGTGWNLAISSCEEKFIHALNSAGIRINRED